jgi:hypothetical protein
MDAVRGTRLVVKLTCCRPCIIKNEPVAERDRFFTAMLRLLGIEKNKPFEPDERQRRILELGLTWSDNRVPFRS